MLVDATTVPTRIFLGAGDVDSPRAKTQVLAAIIDDLGINYLYLEVQGSHESATWIKIIPEMLSFRTRNR